VGSIAFHRNQFLIVTYVTSSNQEEEESMISIFELDQNDVRESDLMRKDAFDPISMNLESDNLYLI
jgi:hypothetical protein